ncbi:MAG: RNA 2',3'-cyclic phosphodiesterase [Treponema sp.]|jgi:2'-5' RNA ligase|nr:RNA 2',3'-cyclic phosphodiesterase [Treponema sp.]
MRCFAALELPEEFLASLTEHAGPLREKHPGFRWTKEENLHITLAFMGEIEGRELLILEDAADAAARTAGAFFIRAGGLFTLPRGKRANVLALGIDEGADRIAALAAGFSGIPGLPGDGEGRPFIPHITLARRGAAALRLSPEERGTAIPARGLVTGLTVFASELRPEGPRYTPLRRFALTPTG